MIKFTAFWRRVIETRLDRYRAASRYAQNFESYQHIVTGEFDPRDLGIKLITLFAAAPHRWGPGKTHLVDTDRCKTLCGREYASTPGAEISGTHDDVDCKGCLNVEETRERWAVWRANSAQREALQKQANARWWSEYNRYLDGARWRAKRDRVMRRARGRCENGCLRHADEVHHLKYPRDCLAGTREWDEQETLDSLIAICHRCHEREHGRKWK